MSSSKSSEAIFIVTALFSNETDVVLENRTESNVCTVVDKVDLAVMASVISVELFLMYKQEVKHTCETVYEK